MRARFTPLFLAICAPLLACGLDRAEPESQVSRRDSADVTIVEQGPLDRGRDILVSREPILRVGVLEGAEEFQFYDVADIKRLADGGFAVANRGSRELMIYNSDGTHRATAGGSGDGPSEFRYPSVLHVLAGDTILVQDFVDRVYFTSRGEFVRRETTSRDAIAEIATRVGGVSEGGRWLANETLFAPVYEPEEGPRTPGPLHRPAMTLVRISSDFAAVDTLGPFGGIEQQLIEVGGERGVMPFVPPFSANTWWTIGARDGTIVIGDNARPEFHRFGPDGSHTIVRWQQPPEAPSSEEVEAWKERQRNASWSQGRLPTLERAWASMDIPDSKPYYGTATAGSDGAVWLSVVHDYDLGGPLTVFGSDGVYRGTAHIPGHFTPHDSGAEWVLGVLRDEYDAEYVQMYRLLTNK